MPACLWPQPHAPRTLGFGRLSTLLGNSHEADCATFPLNCLCSLSKRGSLWRLCDQDQGVSGLLLIGNRRKTLEARGGRHRWRELPKHPSPTEKFLELWNGQFKNFIYHGGHLAQKAAIPNPLKTHVHVTHNTWMLVATHRTACQKWIDLFNLWWSVVKESMCCLQSTRWSLFL